ncbi:MAG: N-acetylmuramoyl-L-alanine amidase [Oscillospiraceae bacterium]|nr:N-acetylmuramoyl-L-alanine amidase [Oscillospiraceae bacterium]
MQHIKLYLDPGHGGRDPGAVGNGMHEADINLAVSLKLADKLRAAGLEIELSRSKHNEFLSINERWQAANRWGATHFVSVHCNAGGGTGCETFVAKTKKADKPFARAVNDTFAKLMGLRNRGVKLDTKSHVGSFGVLRHSRMPAILVELAFIDSPNQLDITTLRNRREEMAAALASGILDYLGVAPAVQQSPSAQQPQVLYRVQVGAFAKRKNAEAMLKRLRKKGFNDAFIAGGQ